jgi:hypothetical protein
MFEKQKIKENLHAKFQKIFTKVQDKHNLKKII